MIISRRKLIVSGLAATASASGVAVAARLAQKYGLIPPDHGGLYGLGETLTYASQRLLTRHSLAREFPRNRISPRPFPNKLAVLRRMMKLAERKMLISESPFRDVEFLEEREQRSRPHIITFEEEDRLIAA